MSKFQILEDLIAKELQLSGKSLKRAKKCQLPRHLPGIYRKP